MSNYYSLFCEACDILPQRIRDAVRRAFDGFDGKIYEIRLYAGGGTVLTTSRGTMYVTDGGGLSDMPLRCLIPTADETELTVLKAAGWSPFAHESEIADGYITFGSGIRLGLGGDSAQSGHLTVRGVNSVNLRIPHSPEKDENDCDLTVFSEIKSGLLIAGEPGSGKTTLLKKASLFLAANGRRVSVIDERRELFGHIGELPPNIDVISGGKKSDGILRAIRLLSPEYVICDEIGSADESDAIRACLNSGVKFTASIHAGSLGQLIRREQFKNLFAYGIFDRVLLLDGKNPGKTACEYTFSEVQNAIRGTDTDLPAYGTRGYFLFGNGKKAGGDMPTFRGTAARHR